MGGRWVLGGARFKSIYATGMQTPVILSIAFLVLIGLVYYFLAKKRRGKDEQEM